MNTQITLCDKQLIGDIPRHTFDKRQEAIDFIYKWLLLKDFEKSVFVCFASWGDWPNNNPRDEHNSILVSHSWHDITDFVESCLDIGSLLDIIFSIYEFDSYQDAFSYCIDLKESF